MCKSFGNGRDETPMILEMFSMFNYMIELVFHFSNNINIIISRRDLGYNLFSHIKSFENIVGISWPNMLEQNIFLLHEKSVFRFSF